MSVSLRHVRMGLSFGAVTAVLVGCTVAGSPYGIDPNEGAARPRAPTSTAATTTGSEFEVEVDAGSTAPVASSTIDASTATIATTVDASTPVVPRPVTCAPKKGIDCEDCCFGKIAGGPAILDKIDSLYSACMFNEGCGPDAACEDFCYQTSLNQGCSGHDAVCDQVDACIFTSACY